MTPVHTQPVAGRWRLGDRLGRGAVADVYDATDETTGERVAVKVLRHADDDQRARLEVELAALEALDHPGIVRVRGHGELDGCPFLVLDCVDGGSLADTLATRGPTSPERAAAIGAALADALDHAHAHGIVHRDVKPSNVLLDDANRPLLADFGVARVDGGGGLTATGFTVGTAAYLAPEQVRGEQIGPAADVYSLGLVVLELLTGTRAFPGSGLTTAMARLEQAPDVPPDVPAPLAAQIQAMTAMDPTARPSARAVAAALAVLADGMAADGTAVLPVVDDATEAVAVAGPTEVPAAPQAHRRPLPGWVVPALCFVAGFLAVLAIRAAASDDQLEVPPPSTAVTTVTTAVPPTTAPPPTTTAPPPPEDGGDDRRHDDDGEEGGGRGNGTRGRDG